MKASAQLREDRYSPPLDNAGYRVGVGERGRSKRLLICAVGQNGIGSMSNVRDAPWVAQLCQIPEALHSGNLAIRTAFEQANPDLNDPVGAVGMIRRHLDTAPHLVGAWQQYSYDKRVSRGPYLDQDEVGFYEGGYQDVRRFDSPVDACAEFIYRESAWVLEMHR